MCKLYTMTCLHFDVLIVTLLFIKIYYYLILQIVTETFHEHAFVKEFSIVAFKKVCLEMWL
jgi:hypothetical protein